MSDTWSTNWDVSINKQPPPVNEEEERIIREAKDRFKICVNWEATARTNFEYDYKFANGDTHNKYQWDNDVIEQRKSRPILTINKTAQHNLAVINDSKQNKPGIRIRPVGDEASYDAAQIFQELIYHIEYISNAENIYDSAMTFQVEAGMGYWRIDTDFISDESFDQEIYIKRIKDPRSVYLDPNITEVDGSDANFGFIFDDTPKDLFAAEYPDYALIAAQSVLGETANDGWITDKNVRVCEYYRRTQKKDKLITWTTQDGRQVIKRKSKLTEQEKQEYDIVTEDDTSKRLFQYQERKIVASDIHWYKIAGDRIIDEGPWLGKYIPIIRLPGTETVINGVLDRKGHTRALIDPQRMYNWNSPLSLNTPLPTPSGWTTMGEVKEGDWLLDENGQPILVIGKSQIHYNHKCYRVNFDNDSFIIADSEHLWTVEERGKRKSQTWDWQNKILTTKELEPKKHFIAVTKALDLTDIDLPIHPYMLGVWLGDGSTAVNIITSGLEDYLDLTQIIKSYGYNVGTPRIYSNSTAVSLTIHGLRNELVLADVLNNKHIPFIYLRASREQRELLLRGLMDTDGHFSTNNNQCIFINTNKLIIDGIVELLRTLGIKSKTSLIKGVTKKFPNGNFYTTEDAYRVAFTADPEIQIFNLTRKLEKQSKVRNLHWRRTKRHKIVSITEIQSVPVQCIVVKSETHLFLAGLGMVPTHNSADVEFGALQTKTPWLAPMAAVEGFEGLYDTANTVNRSWLPYNHIDEDGNPIPAPTRPAPPQASPAYVQRMQTSQNEMMMASGQYQAQFGEAENAKSGVAINARARQGDRATYHFVDNQAIAIRFTGKQLIDLIPKVYDTKRVQRITTRDGSIMNITIDPNAPDALQQMETQEQDKNRKIKEIVFNPNVGVYDIQSDIGPSYATRRMEAFAALTQMATTNEEIMKIGGDLVFKVADFPEADILAERWRRAIPPAILGEGPDPQTEQAMNMAAEKIQQLSGLVGQQAEELKNRDREFKIKEDELELKGRGLKLDAGKAGIAEDRGDYEAETKRLTAIANAGKTNEGVPMKALKPLLEQLLATMKGDNLDETSGGEEEPPVEGARKAKDNNWYVMKDNQYYRVE